MNNFENKRLGNRYILLEKVGDGGMALVYKARCELLNRYVAVKMLRPEYTSDEDFVKKFKSESQAVASLSHPNIVNIFDVGNEDGLSYIVMEYVEGINLKDYIKSNGKMDYKEALKIIKQIAKALEHAHKNGVVHRDIKPHNILIANNGDVKVADFGIAKATTGSTVTNTKSVMGSVHYVSPEQAKGSFVDNRTDIYSLGIVMYELVAGEVPFDGDSPVSIAIRHIQEGLENALKVVDVPSGVASIIIKATQKDPLKRYQSLTEMIEDISTVEMNPNAKLGVNNNSDESTRVIPVSEIEDALNDKTQKINTNQYANIEEDEIEEEDDDEFEDYYEKNRNVKNKKKSSKKGIIIPILLAIITFVTIGSVYAILSGAFTGTEKVKLPSVVGLSQEEATKELQDLGFKVKAIEEESEEESGKVIKMSPEAGTALEKGNLVEIRVSAGTQKTKVPNIRGESLKDAEQILEENGLKLGNTTEEYSDTVDKGEIISQDISAGDEVAKGTLVGVVVSKGSKDEELVRVPYLENKSIEEAKNILYSSGLHWSIVYTSDTSFLNNFVKEQTTPSGTSVKKGTTITLVVNRISNKENGENNSNNNNNNNNNNTNGNTNTEDKDKNNGNGNTNTEKDNGNKENNKDKDKDKNTEKKDEETSSGNKENKIPNALGGSVDGKKDI